LPEEKQELKAAIKIEPYVGKEKAITKEELAKRRLIYFKLEPEVVPEWKKPLLPKPARVEVKPVIKVEEKRFVIDIETTGLDPTRSRIICVVIKDVREPAVEPLVIFDEDEEKLVKKLAKWFKDVKPTHLIGWNISFDLQHILIKLMAYRVQCKEFFEFKIYDIMDVLRRGTELRIYSLMKPSRLGKLAKYLLDQKRLLNYRQIMYAFKRKRFDIIIEHCKLDCEFTYLIWALLMYVQEKLEIMLSEEVETETPIFTGETSTYISCPVCLQALYPTPQEKEIKCPVCGEVVGVS